MSITLIDGYKLDHRRQYPNKTEFIYSNWTPRGSRVERQNEVVFFGLQYFLKKYLMHNMSDFFGLLNRSAEKTSKALILESYKKLINSYLGKNEIGTDHIKALQDLGYVPLEFCALPEGTLTPLRVPMLTVENTHPDFAWVVNYFETILSSVLWMPCTSATTAYRMRKLLDHGAEMTGTDPSFVPWQGHDFSFRGMPGLEAACLSGAGHLLSFTGTDTLPAIEFVNKNYPEYPSNKDYLIGGSVSATEHSVMCCGGEESELDTFNRILDLYPSGIVSIVSDTWDLWHVIHKILPELKDRIMARDGKIVIRPDSGNPADIICGDNGDGISGIDLMHLDSDNSGISQKSVDKGFVRAKGVVEMLWDIFGGKKTSTGHKILDPHIGVIYGDSINYERANEIMARLKAKGFASGNIVFGVGSYSYQYVTRDTYGFAMKSTWARINGKEVNIFKKPVTDNGEKFSAKGRLAVLPSENGLILKDQATASEQTLSMLKPVWRNGEFLKHQSFSEIRKTLHPDKQ